MMKSIKVPLRLCVTILAVVLGVAGTSNVGATPKEAVGFWGTVTGNVKSARPDGSSFVLTVSRAQPDETKSAVKDATPMVGKDLTLGTRMPKKDGKPSPNPEDITYIKSLQAGTSITVKIFAVQADPRVLRIQGPGDTAAPAK
jgi:hypothetical protein